MDLNRSRSEDLIKGLISCLFWKSMVLVSLLCNYKLTIWIVRSLLGKRILLVFRMEPREANNGMLYVLATFGVLHLILLQGLEYFQYMGRVRYWKDRAFWKCGTHPCFSPDFDSTYSRFTLQVRSKLSGKPIGFSMP